MTEARPILPPISREAHERLVAEAVKAERERIAAWFEGQWRIEDTGESIAMRIRKGALR